MSGSTSGTVATAASGAAADGAACSVATAATGAVTDGAVPGVSGAARRPPRMLAVRITGPGSEPVVERLPVPRLAPGEALLRVLAAGLCHTELQLLSGTLNPGVWPLTLGHEIAGEVVQLRPASPVEQSGSRTPVQAGTQAVVHYGLPCGECSSCAEDAGQVCPNLGPQPGLSGDGGFAEYVRVPIACLVPLPAGLDPRRAAPLGCAAATALHALTAVGRVRAGETVVAYGVGGVGLPLVQLAMRAGARVLAVGRSAAKLAMAASYGAEPIDASSGDAAALVRRATGGEGAHAVFELVGSAQTMPDALAMLRRRGRLVLVGYTGARLVLDPLQLVLREIQVRGSVGNTRAELEQVVALAAAGELEVPLDGEYPLDSAGAALARLRSGGVVGRAVLLPQSAPASVATEAARPPAPRAAVPADPATPADALAPAEAVPGPMAPATAVPREPAAGSDGPTAPDDHPLEAELLAFVRRQFEPGWEADDAPSTDAEARFDELARRLFAYQYATNVPYRALCTSRGVSPDTVGGWRDIPPVPIAAFKHADLRCPEPADARAAEFTSSGTTKPELKSRHRYPSLELYDENARRNFRAHLLPDTDAMPMLVLYPPRHELPHSSLGHWLSLQVEAFGAPGSGWFVSEADGLDGAGMAEALTAAQSGDQPVTVLGASFGLVHFLEFCRDGGLSFRLPPGSRVMDTGGYKGRSREYAREDLYAMVHELLGVPDPFVVNMYGMTEHGTQFFDTVLRHTVAAGSGCAGADNRAAGPAWPRRKSAPPWARTRIVDPDTMREVAVGEPGLLLHVDLINRASALAVLTEDVGRAVDDGFEILGRAQGTAARGCSIAMDELLTALGRPGTP